MNVCKCLSYLRLDINFWQVWTEVQISLPKRKTVLGSVSILRLNKYIGTCVWNDIFSCVCNSAWCVCKAFLTLKKSNNSMLRISLDRSYIMQDWTSMFVLTSYLESIVSNYVPWVYVVGWSKALNHCTIQYEVCSASQCWCEGSSTCSKPSRRPSCEGIVSSTNRGGSWSVGQHTLTAPTHSPGGETTHVPSNSAPEGEGITRTGGGSCYQLPDNATCMDVYKTAYLPYLAHMQLALHIRSINSWRGVCYANTMNNIMLKFCFIVEQNSVLYTKETPILCLHQADIFAPINIYIHVSPEKTIEVNLTRNRLPQLQHLYHLPCTNTTV